MTSTTSKRKLPSPAGRRVLRNLAAGRASTFGLSGMSAFGGHSSTMLALRKAGLIEAYPSESLTEAGVAMVANLQAN